MLASVAAAAKAPTLVRVPRPVFPPPLTDVTPTGPARFTVESSVSRDPTLTPVRTPPIPDGAVDALGGELAERAFAQPGTTLVLYGTGVIAGYGPRGGLKYAFDLRSFGTPPRSLTPETYLQEVVWARQLGGLLIVQTNHLGYAADSGGRNGYLTGIDIAAGTVEYVLRELLLPDGGLASAGGQAAAVTASDAKSASPNRAAWRAGRGTVRSELSGVRGRHSGGGCRQAAEAASKSLFGFALCDARKGDTHPLECLAEVSYQQPPGSLELCSP